MKKFAGRSGGYICNDITQHAYTGKDGSMYLPLDKLNALSIG